MTDLAAAKALEAAKEVKDVSSGTDGVSLPRFENKELSMDNLKNDTGEAQLSPLKRDIPNFSEKNLDAAEKNDVAELSKGSETASDRTSEEIGQKGTDLKERAEIEEKKEIQELKEEYIDDIVKRSDVPETIDQEAAKSAEYEKCTPEVTAEKRAEFNTNKDDLKREWERENNQEWPKYEEDVYSENGVKIRSKGQDYDAHHIQPLNMGGENVASNITPMHATEHYDRQGVHAPDSPYAKLEKKLESSAA